MSPIIPSCPLTSTIMSAGYEDPHNHGTFIPESHQFYSSDGTTTQPLWGGTAHITCPSDLSGLFTDPANLSWPETDSTDYSPGAYSDSDRQTVFSSGLSSTSSPNDYVELEPEYSPYGNEPVSPHERWNVIPGAQNRSIGLERVR
jgi:hypothetical protein